MNKSDPSSYIDEKKDTGKGSSNVELEQEANALKLPGFLGCFSKDTMPRIRDGECCVVNIQETHDSNGTALPGTHWVSCGTRKGHSWYFDSFGLGIPPKIESSLRAPVCHQSSQVQANKSDECGLFALAACVEVSHSNHNPSKSIESLVHLFDRPNLEENDRVVKNYLQSCRLHRSRHGVQYE